MPVSLTVSTPGKGAFTSLLCLGCFLWGLSSAAFSCPLLCCHLLPAQNKTSASHRHITLSSCVSLSPSVMDQGHLLPVSLWRILTCSVIQACGTTRSVCPLGLSSSPELILNQLCHFCHRDSHLILVQPHALPSAPQNNLPQEVGAGLHAPIYWSSL